MKVLITGADGFIGKNLQVRLKEESINVLTYVRSDTSSTLKDKISISDVIIHLAGVNRPDDISDFKRVNTDLTQLICDIVEHDELKLPIIFSSSIQAESDNHYGSSKKLAENALLKLAENYGNSVFNYRLPNVFGKWSKPNYNSVVSTFCYNICNDLPIQITDPEAKVSLVYIDDVINSFIKVIRSRTTVSGIQNMDIDPIYQVTVGEIAEQLYLFKESRNSLISEDVGQDFCRALYSTYLSYLKPEQFHYEVHVYTDERGRFAELIKTKHSGQFSFFTAKPGIIRGGHYHHTKNEKFIVVKGNARFRFRHILTNEVYNKDVSSNKLEVVETVPGWCHDIKNIGNEELIVMLWANEIFDRDVPDTIAGEL